MTLEGENRRMARAGLASLFLHGGAGAAVFLGFGSHGAPAAPPPAAMVVEMATLPSAPPVPPSLAPPEPEKQKAQPEPVKDQPKLPPIPKLNFDVKPEVAVPVDEKREEKKEKAEKPAEETTKAAAPEAPRKDAPKAPAIGAPSDRPSNAEQSWEARVLAALERRKRYPASAQAAGQEDVVFVRITMDREGRVSGAQIRRSKGYVMLNDEVTSLVRRASPLPKPPKEVAGDQIQLLVPVEFFIKKR